MHETRLLAAMSHELRTTISTIIGYQELLADGVLGELDPPVADALGRIGSASRQLLLLMGGVLELAELEAGLLDLDRQTVNLAGLVQQVAEDAGINTGEQDRAPIEPATGVPPEIVSDSERLSRVIQLVVSAALRSDPDAPLRLTVRRGQGAGLRIELTGAPPALGTVQPGRLFSSDGLPLDDDRLAEGVRARLAVAHRIARRLGCELRSSTDGEFATLSVRLPDPTADEHEREE